MYKKHIFWLDFLLLHALGLSYATADDGDSYTMQIEPIQYAPESEEQYSGGNAGEVNRDAGGETGCHYIMDLALVFDSSYSMTSDGWSKIKEAAKRLTNGLDVSSDGTHVSILVYNTCVNEYYMFDDSVHKGKISYLIDGLIYCGEWSRLDRALDALPHRVFSPFNGAREDVPKVVVVFTDGKLVDGQPDLMNYLTESIANLRKENITLFGVATESSNYQVLHLIAGTQSRVIDINNMESLLEKLSNASQESCPEKIQKSKDKDMPSILEEEIMTTLTTTLHNITYTVTAGESCFPTPVTHRISSTYTEVTTTSGSFLPTSFTSRISCTGGVAASESLLIAAEFLSAAQFKSAAYAIMVSGSMSLSPSNQPTTITSTATATESLLPNPSNQLPTYVTHSVTAAECLSPTPSNQPKYVKDTVKIAQSLLRTPTNQPTSVTETVMVAYSLFPTLSNQPDSTTDTATTAKSLSPTPSYQTSSVTYTVTAAKSLFPTPSDQPTTVTKDDKASASPNISHQQPASSVFTASVASIITATNNSASASVMPNALRE